MMDVINVDPKGLRRACPSGREGLLPCVCGATPVLIEGEMGCCLHYYICPGCGRKQTVRSIMFEATAAWNAEMRRLQDMIDNRYEGRAAYAAMVDETATIVDVIHALNAIDDMLGARAPRYTGDIMTYVENEIQELRAMLIRKKMVCTDDIGKLLKEYI